MRITRTDRDTGIQVEIRPEVARKVLHLQAECGGALTDQTLDAIARDLAAPSKWHRPVGQPIQGDANA